MTRPGVKSDELSRMREPPALADGPAEPSALPRLATVNRFRDLYSLSRSTAYELITAGKIASVKVGRRRLIDVQSVEQFIATLGRTDTSTALDRIGAEVVVDLSAPPEQSL